MSEKEEKGWIACKGCGHTQEINYGGTLESPAIAQPCRCFERIIDDLKKEQFNLRIGS